jgi:hypothetical protein
MGQADENDTADDVEPKINEGRLVDRLLEKYGHETPIYIQHVSKEGIPIFNIPGIDID